MKRSTDRILTTHVGSLVRTREIIEGMKAVTIGKPYDPQQLAADIKQGIAEVVQKQVDTGIDIPNDGEFGRRGFTSYIHERLTGIEPRQAVPGESEAGHDAEKEDFRDFFRQYEKTYRYMWMLPEVSMAEMEGFGGKGELFKLTGPIGYRGQAAVQTDIANLKAGLKGHNVSDAFITAVTPVSRKSDRNVLDVYPSQEAYLYATADAMHEEYKAITDAGFVVQLDYAALNPQTQILIDKPTHDADELRKARELAVEVVNHALKGIPEDQVRYHHCWGSHNRPHTHDTPLKEIVHEMLQLNVQAYVIEAANARHDHEWQVWKDVKLPDGKILIPGVISHQTNVVEHPELVALRIKNYASVAGKENVIAGADCGFSQYWDSIRLHPSIQWAKLKSLVDGARLASQELWGR